MWISGKRKSTFTHSHEQWASDLFSEKKEVEKQGLSTSYSQIVDNSEGGGQSCWRIVDVFGAARCCGNDEK